MKTVKYEGQEHTYETLREREERLKKVALDLVNKCKGENLTVYEFERVLEIMESHMKSTVVIRDQHNA